ncbi:MAG TPA: DUF945 family protein [Marinobacter sp.]|nr:DUF945 family protein [Marinobacter sp.]
MKLTKWLVAGGIVLACAALTPWGVGYLTEQQWHRAMLDVNSAQPFMQVETRNYQRGLLRSVAAGTLVITDPARGETYQLDFQVNVSHGLTGSTLDFRPEAGWQPEDANWFPENPPKLTLAVRLWGSATLELEAPVTTIDHPASGESLRSSGGVARLSIGSAGEAADMLLVWPALVLSGPGLELALSDLHIEQSLSWLTGDLWTGEGKASIETLSIGGPGAAPVELHGVALTSRSEARDDDQRLDSALELTVDTATYEDQTYGPHRVGVTIDNVDVASWSAFSTAMTEMQALAVTARQGARPGFERQLALMHQVNESVRSLAAAGFSAGVRELLVDTPEGRIEGSLEIAHPELAADEKDTMLMVMQGLTGNVDFSMPVTLAEDYPAVRLQVAPLLKSGLLAPRDDQLVMEGRMKDLVLDLNGYQIPLPPLL